MDIFDYVSQEDVFNRYWFKVDLKTKYINPLRPGDKKPGCIYSYNKGNLHFIDWGASPRTHYSCIDIITQLYNCDFKNAINIIKKDFNINYSPTSFNKTRDVSIKKIENKVSFNQEITKEPCKINFIRQDFNQIDFNFWNQYGISFNTLNKYNVNAARISFINDKIYHLYTNADPQYVYTEKDELHKIYRPRSNKSTKWRTNYRGGILEGYQLLPEKGLDLFITKSLKDVMVLYELGFNAVAVKSETSLASNNAMNILKNRFENIIVFFDNDETGLNSMKKFASEYNVKTIHIPKNLNTKDISDFVKKYNKPNGIKFINESKVLHSH